MKRTITIDLPPALDDVLVDKATGNDTPETLCATIIKEWCEPHAAALKVKQREAMIPVADEILLASPDKQAAAIQAALKVVRS